MIIEYKQLRYLVTVAEHNNVTAAAQALYVSQSAISSAIAQLEAMFEANLIIRHQSKGVSLTPAGRNLVAAARNLLAHADELTSCHSKFNAKHFHVFRAWQGDIRLQPLWPLLQSDCSGRNALLMCKIMF